MWCDCNLSKHFALATEHAANLRRDVCIWNRLYGFEGHLVWVKFTVACLNGFAVAVCLNGFAVAQGYYDDTE